MNVLLAFIWYENMNAILHSFKHISTTADTPLVAFLSLGVF